jgi:hypothetical protein
MEGKWEMGHCRGEGRGLTELLLDLHRRRLDGLVNIIVAQSDPAISTCSQIYQRTYIGTSDGLPMLKLLGVD